MKKLIGAGLILSIGLAGCGSGSGGGDVTLNFNCPADWATCSVDDPETGNASFVISLINGTGGNTMGPLVTSDNMRDAETSEEARQTIVKQFQLGPDSIKNSGTSANGRDFVVFDNQLNPGQTSFVELFEKEGAFFACVVTGPFTSAQEAQSAGEEACSNMS